MRFEAPPQPVEPDLGYKPLALIESEDEWERFKAENESFYRSYSGEFCRHCSTLIGKDYGSYSHRCEAMELSSRYYGPMRAYEAAMREWRIDVHRAAIGNALLDRGFDFDRAKSIVKRGASLKDLAEILEVSLP